jgi:hypothetical protein
MLSHYVLSSCTSLGLAQLPWHGTCFWESQDANRIAWDVNDKSSAMKVTKASKVHEVCEEAPELPFLVDESCIEVDGEWRDDLQAQRVTHQDLRAGPLTERKRGKGGDYMASYVTPQGRDDRHAWWEHTSSATAAVVRMQHVTYILVTGGNCISRYVCHSTYWLPNPRLMAGANELFATFYQLMLTCLYQSSMACRDTICQELRSRLSPLYGSPSYALKCQT